MPQECRQNARTAPAKAAAAAEAAEEDRRVKVRLVQGAVCRSIWALGRVSLCARFAVLSMGGRARLGLQCPSGLRCSSKIRLSARIPSLLLFPFAFCILRQPFAIGAPPKSA